LVFLANNPKNSSNSHYKNWFFESPPSAGFQKTNFGVSSAFGAGNTKIGFIMRIAVKIIPIFKLARTDVKIVFQSMNFAALDR